MQNDLDHPAVLVDGVEKHYDGRAVLRGLDFRVPRGSVVALVGPNGAGKTTTIRMLLGLCAPSAGRIRVVGLEPVRQSFELRRRIGYVPERHHIYEWMTVPEALAFAAELYPTWDWKEYARVDDILGLPRNRKVKDLSRGELAKLALEIAICHKPELLILDEPTSGLDPFVRRQVLDAIINLLEDGRRSVLFSTHILSDVERVADRVVVLGDGRVTASVTLDEARARFVRARFTFDQTPELTELRGAVRLERGTREWIALFDTQTSNTDPRALAAELGAKDCLIEPVSFEDAVIELACMKGDSCWRS